jgi:addiction module RelE/StbE family toxin
MARIIWTEPALNELDEIADYISLDDPNAAKNLVRKAFSSVEHLEHYPESGKLLSEFDYSVYREIVVRPCRIFYRYENDNIFIIHIIRQEQFLHFNVLKVR